MKKTISLIGILALVIALLVQPAVALENQDPSLPDTGNEYAEEADSFMDSVELTPAAADILESELSDEALAFLYENNVHFDSSNQKTLDGVQNLCDNVPGLYGLNEDVLSLKEDAQVYDFSEEQVQKYIEGIVTTTPIIVDNRKDIGKINGRSVTGPIATSRTLDGVGGGYEVKSNSGFFKSTSYLTLPTFQNFYNYTTRPYRTAGYMMFTLGSPANQSAIDIGLSYSKGNTNNDTPQFYIFYYDPTNSSSDPTDPGGVAKFKEYTLSTALTQGMNVYVKVEKIESGTYNGYAKFTVMNATDFSQVYGYLHYYMGSRFPASTGVINRQITLCDGSGSCTNGTIMNEAIFWNSWLYATSGYNAAPSSSNTQSGHRGAFTDNHGDTNVLVNWYATWNEEDVSIWF